MAHTTPPTPLGTRGERLRKTGVWPGPGSQVQSPAPPRLSRAELCSPTVFSLMVNKDANFVKFVTILN